MSSFFSRRLAPLFVACAFLAPRPSAAQVVDPVPSLDLRGYRPSTDPFGSPFLEPVSTPDHGDWNVGIYASYANRPITLRDRFSDEEAFDVIEHQLTADLVGSIGAFGRLSVGFDLPFALYQKGDTPDFDSIATLGPTDIPEQAVGDLGFTGKLALVKPTAGDLGGFALGLHELITVPTGERASFLGEGAVTSTTRLLAEYRLLVLGIHLSGGVKLRAETERFACGQAPVEIETACRQRIGHEIPFGFGFSFRPQALGIDTAGRFTLYLEGTGHLPLYPMHPFQASTLAAFEIGGGTRVKLGDFSLLAGLSTSMVGGIGAGPLRAILSIGWAPRVRDADKDGIPDEIDQCRELAEDKDGFEDQDGCPDGDNDDDGVPDSEDKCPTQQEDEDGTDDDDGCPEPG